MKKTILFLLTCLFISLSGFSQPIPAEKVPANIKQAFAKKFPAATDVKYELEPREYEVSFKDKDSEMSASFDPSGNWLETETGIKPGELPKEVAASVTKNFPGFKISTVSKTETSAGELFYETDLKKEKEKYEVQFSPKGEIMKKKVLKEGK
jgi:uncharacterized membrane protein YkoI